MPRRKLSFVNGNTYHVLNTPADSAIIPFDATKHIKRAVITTKYYQFDELPLKLSVFLSQSVEEKEKILSKLVENGDRIVEIVAYCFIPTRFEFLLKQKKEDGISTFMARFQNSYTRYYNSKKGRKGKVFAGQFVAKLVQGREIAQVSKKIHTLPNGNPMNYEWSSISSYFEENPVFTKPDEVLSFYETKDEYRRFISQTS